MQTVTTEEVGVQEDTTVLQSFDTDEVKHIPIDAIKIKDRKRELSDARASVIAESIKVIGLLQPIVVTKDYHLIAGLHRYTAFKQLGKDQIPAIVKDYKDADEELAEIDENLIRFDLTSLERGEHLARRKELYELKFPQTIDPKRRKELYEKWESAGKPSDDPNIPDFSSEDAKRPDVKPFVVDTAELTGKSTTQVRDEANLGKRLKDELSPEIRELLAPTKAADNKSDLLCLLDEKDEEIRYEAAQMVRDSYDAGEKEIKLVDALRSLKSSPTYETTVSETGEDTLHKTLQKTLKALQLSVNNSKFKEVAETWTYEGVENLRDDFFDIEDLAKRGASILTDIMEAKDKLGKGKTA